MEDSLLECIPLSEGGVKLDRCFRAHALPRYPTIVNAFQGCGVLGYLLEISVNTCPKSYNRLGSFCFLNTHQ